MQTQKYLFIGIISIISIGFGLQAQAQKKKNKPFSLTEEIALLKRADLLPEYRSDCLVEQISSYDTTGGNDDGFSGKYSYIRKENEKLILADLKGPGVINRIWTPTPTDDLISFYFDGEKTPRLEIRFSDLFSGKVYPFIKPVCGNEVGGFYCYVPIPYEKSCKIVFHGEKIMFHQIQYRNLPGYNVKSYSKEMMEAEKDNLENVCQVWSDISPVMNNYATGFSTGFKTEEKTFILMPGEQVPVFEKQTGGRIVGMEIDGGSSFEGLQKDVLIEASWDDEIHPAIYAPLADFFGYAYGKAAMRSMLIGKKQDVNYCFIPFPYDTKARMTLIYKERKDSKQNPIQITAKVYYTDVPRNPAKEGKFYSSWKREINPVNGELYTFANLKGKGHYVGTVHQAQGLKTEMTLFFEGDDSTYVDGKTRMHGTGSEDYYNGGWYALLDRWDRGISLPIHGSLDYSLPMSRTGGYRFYMTDKMVFEKELYIGMEHGPVGSEYPVDYTSVAYYYSDTPVSRTMEPNEKLRTVYVPDNHIYFPQLMELTLGGGAQVKHQRGLRVYVEREGMVRVTLSDVPEGNYKVFLSYFEKPEGADFCVWQRQKRISDWQSTKAAGEQRKDKVYIGDILLTPQTNSLTIHVRRNNEQKEFEFEQLYLEKIR